MSVFFCFANEEEIVLFWELAEKIDFFYVDSVKCGFVICFSEMDIFDGAME